MKAETKAVIEKIVRMAEINHLLDKHDDEIHLDERRKLDIEYFNLENEIHEIFHPEENCDRVIETHPLPNKLLTAIMDGVRDAQNIQMEATKK